jgi:hypothetical protein
MLTGHEKKRQRDISVLRRGWKAMRERDGCYELGWFSHHWFKRELLSTTMSMMSGFFL